MAKNKLENGDNANDANETTPIAADAVNTGTDDTMQAGGEDAEDDFLGAEITVEDRTFGPQFPTVQYVNGKPDKKREGGIAYTGGFFFAAEQGLIIPGFEAYVLTTKDGVEIPGFASRDLTGAPIRWRRAWMATPKEGLAVRFANSEYDEAIAFGKVRGQTHLLMQPNGCKDVVMVTIGGLGSKAIAGQGKEPGALPAFGTRIVGMANRLHRDAVRADEALSAEKRKGLKAKTYPLCAFTLTLGPARNDDGSPKFTEVGKKPDVSMVTFPTWVDAPDGELAQADVQKRFVGKTRFNVLQNEFSASEEWVEAWSDEALAARRAKSGKSAAQSVEASVVNGAATGKPAGQEIPF